MALSENLKLIYNVTSHHPELVTPFSSCVEPLLDIIGIIEIPQPPLQPPVNLLINALSQLDLQTLGSLAADIDVKITKMTSILDKATLGQAPADLEILVVPLIHLLMRIYEVVPDASKQHMQSLLLPSTTDRELPIGQSDSLSSRLLRLTTDPLTLRLREVISSLYFELSSRDPTTFVHNVGYGYASGFLVYHNIAVPSESSRTEGSGNTPVNPITGQRLDKEPSVDTGPEMTQEEKEREAERLFVLFQRLKATGVVDVKNPVEEAMQSGRVEEVEDDSDED